MVRDGHVLCSYMVMFTQSNYPIGLKFHQHQYVTMLFNPIDQDLNMILLNHIIFSINTWIYYIILLTMCNSSIKKRKRITMFNHPSIAYNSNIIGFSNSYHFF